MEPKFTHKTPHLGKKQHQLDPNIDLKHLVHHGSVQYVDRDVDGDADVYDNPKKGIPDENPVGDFATVSKKMIAKQKGEIKHTKRGMAYENLDKWFGKGEEGGIGGGGWDRYNTKGERIGKCAREPGEPKPKCLSKEKAAKMSKDEIAAAVKRKRKEDPVADRPGKGGKPKMVSNEIEEQFDEERYCPMCKKKEKRMECSYGPAMWDAVTVGKTKVLESKKPEPDHEHSMARSELSTIEKAVKRLKSKMKGEGNIEAWVQSKITKAADYIDSAADYLDSGEHNSEESVDEAKCWKGYKRKPGTKEYEKGSCVKEGGLSFEISPEHRKAQRDTKIRKRTQTDDEGSKIALKKVTGPNAPLVKPGDTKIRNMYSGYEPSLVDKIILEMEAEVLTEKNKPTNPKLWAKWKAKAKAKFDVYPSAYANGWAAKGYKSEGGGWKSIKEETIEDVDGNTFVEVIDIITPDSIKSVEVKESIRIPSKTGNIILVSLTWRGKYFAMKMFFPQITKPSRTEVQDQIEKVYPGCKVQSYYISDIKPGEQFLQVEDWQKINRQDETDGMSKAAVDAYRKQNPDSQLQTAVTEPNPTGSRKERKSAFCSRMKGMKDKLTSKKTANDPNSKINKALDRWNCN